MQSGHAQTVSTLAASYTITDLGVLPGGTVTEAGGINNRAEVVGSSGAINEGGTFHAFLWANGKMRDLGTLETSPPFLAGSSAAAINAHGQVTGTTTLDSSSVGFLWTAGFMRPIGTVKGGVTYGYAINDQGVVVGQIYIPGLPRLPQGNRIIMPLSGSEERYRI